MTEIRTYTGATVRSFYESPLLFCFVLSGLKSFLVYISFLMPTQSSSSHIPSCIACGQASCLACHPYKLHDTSTKEYLQPVYFRKQVDITLCNPLNMLHFCGGIILFTLGNRCISCYAIHATYAACQRDLSG